MALWTADSPRGSSETTNPRSSSLFSCFNSTTEECNSSLLSLPVLFRVLEGAQVTSYHWRCPVVLISLSNPTDHSPKFFASVLECACNIGEVVVVGCLRVFF